MNTNKSVLTAIFFILVLAAALAGAAPALAGTMTLYEAAPGSTIEIGGRGLSFTNVADGVTHVLAGAAGTLPARYKSAAGTDLRSPALEVRFLDGKGKPVGTVSSLVYVFFNLDPAERRLWDRDGEAGISLWFAGEASGGWQPCPAFLVDAGADGRLACLAPGSGYYAVGRGAGEPSSSSGSAGTTATPCEMPAGLTGWWSADFGTNNIVGGPDATLVGDATIAGGQFHGAFALDGDGDYVDVPNDPALDLTGDFTISLWAYFNTTEGEQVLIEKYVQGDGPVDGWTLTKLENQAIRFAMENVEGAHVNLDTPELALLPGEWVHFAVVRRGAAITIFANGVPMAYTPSIGAIDMSTEASLKLGHRGDPDDTPGSSDTSGFYLNGLIDEVQIWNGTGLSDAQVRWLYDRPECLCKPGAYAGAQPADEGHRIYVQLHDGGIRYEYAVPGTLVTFSIYDAPAGNLLWSGNRCADASGFSTIAPGEHPIGISPGLYVTVSDGRRTVNFVVEPLTIEVLDPDENVLAGTAAPGEQVLIGFGPDPGCSIHVQADENGAWSFDFDDLGCDLTAETGAYAQVFDPESDTSEVWMAGDSTGPF